jgi:hypothetical protein
MTPGNNRHLCLKLADKSLFTLYKPGETGERNLTLTPASQKQMKNNISLHDCTGPGEILLRDILVENTGDMFLYFSLGQNYLSYQIRDGEGDMLETGLIELSLEDEFVPPAADRKKAPVREAAKAGRRGGLLLFSVTLSLLAILLGAWYLTERTDRTVLPPLALSEMPAR